jgi:sporulation protein YlmC with PRC-barrel domain
MPHFGILHEYRFDDIQDVRGSEVYGVNDENLGTIDDVVFDHSTGDIRYVVLKTGLLGKRVIVPANRIDSYGNHEDKFYADLDKERLEMLPEFKDGHLKSEQDWSIYEKEYQSRLNDGAVLYNKDTGRIVTPPIEQVEGTGTTPLSASGRQSLDRDLTPQRMGQEDTLIGGGGSVSEKTTLQPQKASIAGKEDVASARERQIREVMSPGSSELETDELLEEPIRASRVEQAHVSKKQINEATIVPPQVPVREVMNPMGGEFEYLAEEQNDRLSGNLREPGIYKVSQSQQPSNLGSRWSSFQDRLRSRRDKIVVDCPDCASQEKVA